MYILCLFEAVYISLVLTLGKKGLECSFQLANWAKLLPLTHCGWNITVDVCIVAFWTSLQEIFSVDYKINVRFGGYERLFHTALCFGS